MSFGVVMGHDHSVAAMAVFRPATIGQVLLLGRKRAPKRANPGRRRLAPRPDLEHVQELALLIGGQLHWTRGAYGLERVADGLIDWRSWISARSACLELHGISTSPVGVCTWTRSRRDVTRGA